MNLSHLTLEALALAYLRLDRHVMGGPRNEPTYSLTREHPIFTLDHWREAVYQCRTSSGYNRWVRQQVVDTLAGNAVPRLYSLQHASGAREEWWHPAKGWGPIEEAEVYTLEEAEKHPGNNVVWKTIDAERAVTAARTMQVDHVSLRKDFAEKAAEINTEIRSLDDCTVTAAGVNERNGWVIRIGEPDEVCAYVCDVSGHLMFSFRNAHRFASKTDANRLIDAENMTGAAAVLWIDESARVTQA